MAGDWIKMRVDLQTHPKIVRILSATKADKFRAIGGLHAVWSVFDTHSTDGSLHGYTPDTLDHIIGWGGFSGALVAVGWLAFDGEETLTLPEFTEHNGQSGKRRAEDQKRKRDGRRSPDSVTDDCGQIADKKRTREEKRREEENQEIGTSVPAPPGPPKRQKRPEQTFTDWADSLDGDAIPPTDPVFAYAAKAGLPGDYVPLAWAWFEAEYGDGGPRQTKRYADWRAVFRKVVSGNWGKLWAVNRQGEFYLTTEGVQAQRALA